MTFRWTPTWPNPSSFHLLVTYDLLITVGWPRTEPLDTFGCCTRPPQWKNWIFLPRFTGRLVSNYRLRKPLATLRQGVFVFVDPSIYSNTWNRISNYKTCSFLYSWNMFDIWLAQLIDEKLVKAVEEVLPLHIFCTINVVAGYTLGIAS